MATFVYSSHIACLCSWGLDIGNSKLFGYSYLCKQSVLVLKAKYINTSYLWLVLIFDNITLWNKNKYDNHQSNYEL
ncbi:hypothetical protein DMC15_06190 [Vibrio sp. 11986-1-5]|nr:hypothetical protein DMC15_06190 [Vibrio sp. 11986-1-5]